VRSIARGYQDPHYVEAKPSYMVTASRSDLLFYVGMELEIGWLPLLLQGSRNPDLETVALNEDIEPLQVPEGELSRRFGDIHPEGNPHYWLDPRNGSLIAAQVARVLKAHLPVDRHQGVDDRLAAFDAGLQLRITDWERRLAPWRGLRIAAYHQQFEYFFAFAGWEAVDYIEEKPGVPPSPRHVADLERMMRSEGIGLVVSSNFIDPRIPERIAQRTDAAYMVLPASVGGEDDIDDYFDLFEHIVAKIERDLPPRVG
jgi:ABC-type Zn uptake system ZnuABC Zn-binding protein ZnuA